MPETGLADAYICLGSNQGDARLHLARAREALGALPGVARAVFSSIYLTEPQEKHNQPWFHNQVARLACEPALTPETLLDALLAIETRLGRLRDPQDRFGPRAIDLDLLLFGQERRRTERLILPHPRMEQRAFVLVPLREIAPDLIIPGSRTVDDALRALPHTVEGATIFQPPAKEPPHGV